ncbi:flavodoxin domain-containing protein [Pararhodobacter aggregans]|uniref:Nitric oxide synthase n=1 Tax=Pararhodobacter aggregans TaxID=404875 RepID=A0A2T7ULX2_9RHOB|nr:flavodoxin domain-containing protein [Pararhodobacter aggregans]PTW99939.1 MioC protein [Pararhodobacter aggregans]PVE45700.1 nitric oxide synthase [Pararhodobacter aggregans]
MQIAVLYGTETGNAEMLAEDIASHLSDHDASVTNLSDFDPAGFDPETFYIVVTSTYGDGELPASAQPFAAAMEKVRPDLTGLRFAIFGMGDSEYPETFNFGGKRLEEILTGAGAERVGERVTHDASGADMADDLALPWIDAILSMVDA